jgi:DNA-binding NtrC family response regulator
MKVRESLGSPRAPGTILVVDDEAGIRSLLRQILVEAGYRVLEAKDGREAQLQVEGSEVDLVITDLAMPDKDGIETIQALHRERPRLKMIAMSGQFSGPSLQAAEALGAQASLDKPIQRDELLDAVARLMPGRKGTRPNIKSSATQGRGELES